jgi:hypothetical protein
MPGKGANEAAAAAAADMSEKVAVMWSGLDVAEHARQRCK